MKKTPQQVFAENLARYLKERSLTQRELAGFLGVAAPTINDWLHCRKFPRIDKIQALAGLLNVKPSELIEENGTEIIVVFANDFAPEDFMLIQQFVEYMKAKQPKQRNGYI